MKLSTSLTALLFVLTTFNLSTVYAQSSRSTTPNQTTTALGGEVTTQSTQQCGTMNAKACRAFHQVNHLRIQKGLQPLNLNNRCMKAAQYHSRNMAKNGFFSHDAPGETWKQRMQRYRLLGSAVAENIAMTSSGPKSALNLWVNSPGHYQNMVSGKFRSGGMGHVNGYYVHCFSGDRGIATK